MMRRKWFILSLSATFAVVVLLSADACLAQAVSFGTPIDVKEKYTAPASEADSKPRGISGMACLGAAGDEKRQCLVINDEETFAEIAIFKDGSLTPTGKKLRIVESGEAGDSIVGAQRNPGCGNKGKPGKAGKFSEIDGEGVAVSQGYVYIASSHSCSGGGKYKPSSYLLSRARLAGPDAFPHGKSAVVERSWRGADMLFHSDAGGAFGEPKEVGTNIEGVAVIGEYLYAGLRTPVSGSSAFLIRAPVEALFAPGTAPLSGDLVKTRSLMLGADTGVRDLAALADGSLLILAGPSLSQDVDYKIWHLPNPVWTSQPTALVVVKTKAKAEEKPKAESLTVIEQSGKSVVVVVNYDNINEGAPARHEFNIGP
jgi:Protein of unknown function (DUF3616)